MKKLFLVANWKSNKSVGDAHSFLREFLNHEFITWYHTQRETKRVIICPPTILLPELARMIEKSEAQTPIFLGGQDVSPFSEGPHTGEIAASQLAEFANYVIVGHSERRLELQETDELIATKVKEARRFGLEPIVCVQGKDTPVPDGVHILAYEPLDAISTAGVGKPLDPASANEVAHFFKHEKHIPYVLYGGSVDPTNVHSYTSQEDIDGVLVGGKSLDPHAFAAIVKNS